MNAHERKRLDFALSAHGIDPATVTVTEPTWDELHIDCEPGDTETVLRVLKMVIAPSTLLNRPK